jgi:type II secretory pathway pseudopilin PulG
MRYHHPRRGGFTLVELMMAAALAVLIMTVLAWAFSAATDNLRYLKATGDLASRLRTADVQLRADLAASHFDDGDSGGILLSDLRFDRLTPGGGEAAPPGGGFFMIRQGNGSIFEGTDQDTVYSTRADANTATNPNASGHVLGMAVRRSGKTQDQLFTADVSALAAAPPILAQFLAQNATDTATPAGTTFVSNWAEVYWFLGNPQVVGGVQSYTLYRRTRLLTKTPIDAIPPALFLLLQDVISLRPSTSSPGNYITNTTDSIRAPGNRFYGSPVTTPSPILPASAKFGDDIVLTNVLSFEVKAAWAAGPQWQKPASPGPGPPLTYAPNAPSRIFVAPPAVAIPVGTTYIPFPTPGPVASPALAYQNGDEPFDDIPVRNAIQADPFRPENIGDEATSAPGPWNGAGGAGTRVFDTWAPLAGWNTPGNPNCIPFRARVSGVKVKVRVFDVNTQLARQVTIVVPL